MDIEKMTLTPDRKSEKQDWCDNIATPAVPAVDGDAAERERSSPEESDRVNPWTADGSEPTTRAEVQRVIADLDAEKEAWRRARSEEAKAERDANYAAFMKTPEYREQKVREETEEAQFAAERAAADEQAAHAQQERAERQREVLASLGPAPSDGVVGSGFSSELAAKAVHPLLNDQTLSEISRVAPEVTESVEGLQTLVGELQSFTRPMGPDDAVAVMEGIEAINRLVESLSIVTLSVFQRSGTPRDYGAKSTRELVENRLSISGREAARRVDLAEDLGKQVSVSGQSVEPRYPAVSAGLLQGVLSVTQADTIIKCLHDIPSRLGSDARLQAEVILVENAPLVRVRDIRVLLNEILAWLDPDGVLPEEPPERDDLAVNLRERKDGKWVLKGVLDAVTGGIMNGLLTSRIKADSPDTEQESDQVAPGGEAGSSDGTDADEEGADEASTDSANADKDELDREIVDVFSQVLRGDRSDALEPTPAGSAPKSLDGWRADDEPAPNARDHEVSMESGVREDGTIVPMGSQQPTVKNKIYERFATMIGRIEMKRAMAGAPFALVVTAKAEDLAKQSGRATTGAEVEFPMHTAALEGLNGAVFFHLMSDKSTTMQIQTESRFATPKQMTILSSRDQGCTFPGCSTPPGWCDAHHIVPWADNGNTSINNLTLACSAHHHLIDKSDWHTVMLKDGRPAWVPPATIDPERRPILHARFIAREISDTLFD